MFWPLCTLDFFRCFFFNPGKLQSINIRLDVARYTERSYRVNFSEIVKLNVAWTDVWQLLPFFFTVPFQLYHFVSLHNRIKANTSKLHCLWFSLKFKSANLSTGETFSCSNKQHNTYGLYWLLCLQYENFANYVSVTRKGRVSERNFPRLPLQTHALCDKDFY